VVIIQMCDTNQWPAWKVVDVFVGIPTKPQALRSVNGFISVTRAESAQWHSAAGLRTG
jgi:hypothetical protein